MQGIVKGGLNDGSSNIKSRQYGNQSFSNGTSSQNITINSVDLTKSIVRITYKPSTTGSDSIVSVKFTNSTTITLNRSANASTESVYWEVIEFNNVKSLQSGSTTLTTSPQLISITSASISKTLTYGSVRSAGSVGVGSQMAVIQNSTTQITYTGASTSGTLEWFVVEFN